MLKFVLQFRQLPHDGLAFSLHVLIRLGRNGTVDIVNCASLYFFYLVQLGVYQGKHKSGFEYTMMTGHRSRADGQAKDDLSSVFH